MIADQGSATVRVARLERLLERVRNNAAHARPSRAAIARAVSAKPASTRSSSDDMAVDYDIADFSDAEIVEITVDDPITEGESFSVEASGFEAALPEGIMPLADGGEALITGVVSTHPPGYSLDEGSIGEEVAIPLQAKGDSEPPAWQPGADQPTMEQLGATIGLDAGSSGGPALELDMQHMVPEEQSELEISLPSRGFAGGYDESLTAPANAQQDLAAFSGADIMGASPSAPHVIQRSAFSTTVPVAEILDNRVNPAGSFVALLDDSLRLKGG